MLRSTGGLLLGPEALNASQLSALNRLGWSSPTGTPEGVLANHKAGGSPNFFRDFDRPVPYADAARMAVRALTEVLEIPHPGSLMYKAFDKKQRTILVPTLGLMREEPAPPPEKPREGTVEELRKLVIRPWPATPATFSAAAEDCLCWRLGAGLPLPRGLPRQIPRTLDPLLRARSRIGSVHSRRDA